MSRCLTRNASTMTAWQLHCDPPGVVRPSLLSMVFVYASPFGVWVCRRHSSSTSSSLHRMVCGMTGCILRILTLRVKIMIGGNRISATSGITWQSAHMRKRMWNFVASTPNPSLNRTPAGGLSPARRSPVSLLR